MVQTCPNCGSPNRQGYRFCSNCGTPLSAQAPAKPRQEEESGDVARYTVQNWEERVVDDPAFRAPGSVVPPTSSAPPVQGSLQGQGSEAVLPSSSAPRRQLALSNSEGNSEGDSEGVLSAASVVGRRSPAEGTMVPAPSWSGRGPTDLPPIEMDRKGEATYAAYTESASGHIERSIVNRSWLIPVIAVSALLLVLLAGVSLYLVLSPRNAGVTNPDAAGPISPPASTPSCPLARDPTLEDQVKHVVCVSNEEQIRALRDLDTEVLKGSRTGEALKENIDLVEHLRKQHLYGEPLNIKLDILDVQIDGDKATVKTYEVWTVTFYSQSDNKVVQKRGPDKYNETYHLVKLDGKWLIERVDFVALTPGPAD